MCNGEHNNKRWTKEEEGEEGRLEGKGYRGLEELLYLEARSDLYRFVCPSVSEYLIMSDSQCAARLSLLGALVFDGN